MTAAVIDSLRGLARMYYNAHAKSPDTSDVEHVRRPYEPEPVVPTITMSELKQFLED
jgi:hypothetical protein